MRSRVWVVLVVSSFLFGSFAASNYAAGESKSKTQRWEYRFLAHGPNLKKGGSDLKKIKKIGAEGWELASSYRSSAEVVVSIFKRRK